MGQAPLPRLAKAPGLELDRSCDIISREIEPKVEAVHKRVIGIYHMGGARLNPDKSWVDDNEKDAWAAEVEVLQAFGKEIDMKALLELQYAIQTRRGIGYGEIWEKEKALEPQRQSDVTASIGSAISLMHVSDRGKAWDGFLKLKYQTMVAEKATQDSAVRWVNQDIEKLEAAIRGLHAATSA